MLDPFGKESEQIKEKRQLEISLLAVVLLFVVCGASLVFLGKKATTSLPAHVFNINTATAGEYTQILHCNPNTGIALTSKRQTEPDHQWPSVFDFEHTKVLRSQEISIDENYFIARTPSQVAQAFWDGMACFILVFFFSHFLIRKLAPSADPFLLPLTALLSGLGLLLVYSVEDPYRDTFAFHGQLWGVACYGLLALILPLTPRCSRLPLRRYQYAYVALAVLFMVALKVFGRGPGGVPLTLFGIEPVEVIKLLLMLFVVSYLSERHGLNDSTRALPLLRDFLPLAMIYGFALLLFMVVKDLGPAVLLFGVFLALLYLNTQKAIYPAVGVLLLLAAAVLADKAHFGFFPTRVTMWENPWNNSSPRGAQLAEGIWGMATGGWGGSGLGLGQPQLMPRAGSDLIFAALGEQMGFLGTAGTIFLYLLLLRRGMTIATQALTDFDRLLAAGITIVFSLQIMIILGGVTGLVPLTGMTLPFLSFGASSLVINFFMIGLLLQISAKALPPEAVEHVSPRWLGASRVISAACVVYLVIGIGVYKLMDFQGLRNTFFATRLLYTPDADGVSRPHINPRLLMYAAAIPRGEILDRNGVVLAEDAFSGQAGSTDLLTPDSTPRIYTGGAACAHLMLAVEGNYGPLAANKTLRGYESYSDLLPFYRRYGIASDNNAPAPIPPAKRNVQLTIDLALQQAAFHALQRYAFTGRAAAVALNAGTGQVLAAVSLPSFDPATLTPTQWTALHTDADASHALLFRPTDGLYPPGSVFKIVTATAGMEHGLTNFTFDCPHSDWVQWDFRGRRYTRFVTDEAGFPPFGETDMAKAIRVSCNVYFAHLGVAMGAQALEDTARNKFHLNHIPSLGRLGAALPDCAYGQGPILTSPLGMAQATQAVANNGLLLPPTFLLPAQGTQPPLPTQTMSVQEAQRLQGMLAAVTVTGTAEGVFNGLPVSVAGKTGSAQNNQGDRVSHSWFIGFAPATNPTLAFSCIVENGGAGRSAAAPVCRAIIQQVFGH